MNSRLDWGTIARDAYNEYVSFTPEGDPIPPAWSKLQHWQRDGWEWAVRMGANLGMQSLKEITERGESLEWSPEALAFAEFVIQRASKTILDQVDIFYARKTRRASRRKKK